MDNQNRSWINFTHVSALSAILFYSAFALSILLCSAISKVLYTQCAKESINHKTHPLLVFSYCLAFQWELLWSSQIVFWRVRKHKDIFSQLFWFCVFKWWIRISTFLSRISKKSSFPRNGHLIKYAIQFERCVLDSGAILTKLMIKQSLLLQSLH